MAGLGVKHFRLIAIGAFVGVALLLWLERWSGEIDRAEMRSLAAWESTAAARAIALKKRLQGQVRVFDRWVTRWDTIIRLDTLRGDTVWIPVTVLTTADSAIRSCSIALTTCQELAALQGARADSALRLAALWHRQARGPLLRPSAELVFLGRTPRLAGVLEAGPRRLSAVARLEVDSLPRFAAGVRYQF